MILRAPIFVSDSYEGVKNPALVTHPPRIAEEKGRPKEVYIGVPGVILPRRHRPVTNVPFFGLAVQEEIRLMGWQITPRQIVSDVDMIVEEPHTLGKWEMQEGKCKQQWEDNVLRLPMVCEICFVITK
ncbi:hypothetical protein V6N13_132246 [Hibiscus sabdariffa]|uniref:Uncharacterized protein n=1 Tax=Hibiscus sabdariffa TaxID=183260 RepID=A0ABR2PUQ2_9ROSI